ncbi:hypothetical protein BW727_100248 [Jeotgalibaca dankookensis]|uniref:Sortase A n=1 Tax=Jeotgalibaca dankookensis TaxID=708126 RepID=A0A1S6IMA0_9LACT|nr:class D sortase [Jeotgalibaca dankookensis]AQS52656.1 hypothetical protein BW727_100248 [Jeotgalibaca dankookensis]
MKWISRMLILIGVLMIGIAGFSLYDQTQRHSFTLEEAQNTLEKNRLLTMEEDVKINGNEKRESNQALSFEADYGEVLGVLTIPKLNRSIGIMEGSDDDAMRNGAGHVESTAFPGQREQIIFSGHRETVFRDFGELEIGDQLFVEMTYGRFAYEIKAFEIVDSEDTSVIKKMGEEVLVVSTCYPFNVFEAAPQRYLVYAYPLK